MTLIILIILILSGLVRCALMGLLTQWIIRNKGYTTNWFWWGFFFGIFAVIVALTRPKVSPTGYSQKKWWRCSCGRMNPYMVRCNCGKTQGEAAAEKK